MHTARKSATAADGDVSARVRWPSGGGLTVHQQHEQGDGALVGACLWPRRRLEPGREPVRRLRNERDTRSRHTSTVPAAPGMVTADVVARSARSLGWGGSWSGATKDYITSRRPATDMPFVPQELRSARAPNLLEPLVRTTTPPITRRGRREVALGRDAQSASLAPRNGAARPHANVAELFVCRRAHVLVPPVKAASYCSKSREGWSVWHGCSVDPTTTTPRDGVVVVRTSGSSRFGPARNVAPAATKRMSVAGRREVHVILRPRRSPKPPQPQPIERNAADDSAVTIPGRRWNGRGLAALDVAAHSASDVRVSRPGSSDGVANKHCSDPVPRPLLRAVVCT